MKVLAIESSCDETAAAIVEDGRKVLSDKIISQVDLHKIYGGVVPEIASRSHAEVISMLAQQAIEEAGIAIVGGVVAVLRIQLLCLSKESQRI